MAAGLDQAGEEAAEAEKDIGDEPREDEREHREQNGPIKLKRADAEGKSARGQQKDRRDEQLFAGGADAGVQPSVLTQQAGGGEDKQKLTVEKLVEVFKKIKNKEFASDRGLLAI